MADLTLDSIRQCIDGAVLGAPVNINRLFELILTDPKGVINKISTRQLGVQRIRKLHTYISALDRKKLGDNHSFELVLMAILEQELGVGMFGKDSLKKRPG